MGLHGTLVYPSHRRGNILKTQKISWEGPFKELNDSVDINIIMWIIIRVFLILWSKPQLHLVWKCVKSFGFFLRLSIILSFFAFVESQVWRIQKNSTIVAFTSVQHSTLFETVLPRYIVQWTGKSILCTEKISPYNCKTSKCSICTNSIYI